MLRHSHRRYAYIHWCVSLCTYYSLSARSTGPHSHWDKCIYFHWRYLHWSRHNWLHVKAGVCGLAHRVGDTVLKLLVPSNREAGKTRNIEQAQELNHYRILCSPGQNKAKTLCKCYHRLLTILCGCNFWHVQWREKKQVHWIITRSTLPF